MAFTDAAAFANPRRDHWAAEVCRRDTEINLVYFLAC